jgi:hypothetical protein
VDHEIRTRNHRQNTCDADPSLDNWQIGLVTCIETSDESIVFGCSDGEANWTHTIVDLDQRHCIPVDTMFEDAMNKV